MLITILRFPIRGGVANKFKTTGHVAVLEATSLAAGNEKF